jgi:hypothetical protein
MIARAPGRAREHVRSFVLQAPVQVAREHVRSFVLQDRGAVYVEFLIGFMPVFVFFLGIWQLGMLYVGRIVVGHAAMATARAAAVVIAEPEGGAPHTLTAGKRKTIEDAAAIVLAPLLIDGFVQSMRVTIPATTFAPLEAGKPVTMVTAQVDVDFVCDVTIVNVLVCDRGAAFGRTRALSAEASFPYQGARYRFSGNGNNP